MYNKAAEKGRDFYSDTEDVVRSVFDTSADAIYDTYGNIKDRASEIINRGAEQIQERIPEPRRDYSQFLMQRASDLDTFLIGRFIEGLLYGIMDI